MLIANILETGLEGGWLQTEETDDECKERSRKVRDDVDLRIHACESTRCFLVMAVPSNDGTWSAPMSWPVPLGKSKVPEGREPELGVVELGEAAAQEAWPLETAAKFVDRYAQRDRAFPDIDVLSAAEKQDTRNKTEADLPQRQHIFDVVMHPLPAALFNALDHKGKIRMGVLSLLRRAWIAQGKKLFFWSLDSPDEFIQLDNVSSEILSVSVAPPKANVFIESVTHVLLISTHSHMLIYAVHFNNDSNEFNVWDADLAIPMDGLGTPTIYPLSDGRILFIAENSGTCIWEARYQATESWFRPRASRVGVAGGSSWFGFGGYRPNSISEKIVEFAVDQSRQLAYLITSKSIHVYSYAQGTHEKTLTPQLEREETLVGCSCLSEIQSRAVWLVCMTSKGSRVFCRCDAAVVRPMRTLTAKHVLPSPLLVSQPITKGWVFGGYLTIAVEDKRLLLSCLDQVRVLSHVDLGAAPAFTELSAWSPIEGRVYAVDASGLRFGARPPDVVNGPPTVTLLTDRAVYHVRPRPFSERIDASRAFAAVYGPMEICAGSLEAATRPGASSAAVQTAVSVFFKFGGLPLYQKDAEAARRALLTDPRAALEPRQAVRLSALFDGLAIYTYRCLAELWDEPLLGKTPVESKNQTPKYDRLGPSRDLLEKVYTRLSTLCAFLNKNRSFSEGMSSRPLIPESITLSQVEHRALSAVTRLARSAQEGIAFLLLILSETGGNLGALLGYFTPEGKAKLQALSFRSFCAQAKNSEVVRELITALVNLVIHRGDPIYSVARVIEDRCSSYCSGSDVLVYKALEHLHSARGTDFEPEMHLKRATALFKQAAGNLQLDTLKEVTTELQNRGYAVGAAEVALAAASERDPAHLALGYIREGKPASDPREQAYQTRYAAYELIFATGMPDSVLKVGLASDDEVWHFTLYDWLLEHEQAQRLASVTTPYLQAYLQQSASTSLQAADLLWRFYRKRGDLLASADVLLALARGPLSVTIQQRVEFLSRAMGYCQCPHPLDQREAGINLTTMVQAYLQIANIQADLGAAMEADGHKDERLETRLLTLSELFNEYADPLGYHEICLAIFAAADFRDQQEIKRCWQALIAKSGDNYIQLGATLSSLGQQFLTLDFVFPLEQLLPILEQHNFDYCRDSPAGWLVEAFLNAGVTHRVLYKLLMDLLVTKPYPFDSQDSLRVVASDVSFLVEAWKQSGDEWEMRHIVKEKDISELTELLGRESIQRLIAS